MPVPGEVEVAYRKRRLGVLFWLSVIWLVLIVFGAALLRRQRVPGHVHERAEDTGIDPLLVEERLVRRVEALERRELGERRPESFPVRSGGGKYMIFRELCK